jgi:predicted RNA methylase
MHKNKSQKPGGCKAAKVPTLEQLRAQRDMMENKAREHALKSALAYYFKIPIETPLHSENVNALRKVVFGNWLHQHIFTEKFQPMHGIGR